MGKDACDIKVFQFPYGKDACHIRTPLSQPVHPGIHADVGRDMAAPLSPELIQQPGILQVDHGLGKPVFQKDSEQLRMSVPQNQDLSPDAGLPELCTLLRGRNADFPVTLSRPIITGSYFSVSRCSMTE